MNKRARTMLFTAKSERLSCSPLFASWYCGVGWSRWWRGQVRARVKPARG